MIKLLDCTVRDGGYLNNWDLTDDEFLSILNTAHEAQIDYFEIGYRSKEQGGRFRRCLESELGDIIKKANFSNALVMLNCSEFQEELFTGANKDFITTVRVACHSYELIQGIKITETLLDKGYKVFLHLMNVKDLEPQHYELLQNWGRKEEIISLYFADSYGSFFNENVEFFYNKLKNCGYDKISFHAHNNLQMALSNTLKARELGTFSVDVSVGGKGRGGGNLSAETLLAVLNPNKLHKIYEIYSKITPQEDLKKIIAGVANLHPSKVDEFLQK